MGLIDQIGVVVPTNVKVKNFDCASLINDLPFCKDMMSPLFTVRPPSSHYLHPFRPPAPPPPFTLQLQLPFLGHA